MCRMWAALLAVVVSALLAGCQTTAEQADFLAVRGNDRAAVLATYPREQQWRLFKYANQVIHPPMTGLSSVLAREGEPMLRLILASLDTTDNDLDYRDGFEVFADMQRIGSYRVCVDRPVLAKIEGYRGKIRDVFWREYYGDTLREMCRLWSGPSRERT